MIEEAEARRLLDVSRETMERLKAFEVLLSHENERQNLVSRASIEAFWSRHIYDSAQLLRFAPPDVSTWIDLGSGAGFPGLIIATLYPCDVTLVEARRLRVDFLRRAALTLGVESRVEILHGKAEAVPERPFDVISARAFAPLGRLLSIGMRFSTDKTRWILPKGRNAQTELVSAESSWHGDFRLEPSLTDADAKIIVASGVRPKGKGKSPR